MSNSETEKLELCFDFITTIFPAEHTDSAERQRHKEVFVHVARLLMQMRAAEQAQRELQEEAREEQISKSKRRSRQK